MKPDFDERTRKAMEEEMRSFTTISGLLTVVEGEEPYLCIDGAGREWYFDRERKEFHWVDRGVTPQTWVPYRYEAGKWEWVANIYEIVGTAPYEPWRTIEPVWRAVGDPRVLALLSALKKAVEDYHSRRKRRPREASGDSR